jgi:hypothetical protein
MTTNQERLYAASQIVSNVANCLIDYASSAVAVELFDILELVGRLDMAVESIRMANGAADWPLGQ